MKTIVLVAADEAPSRAFSLLAPALENLGHKAVLAIRQDSSNLSPDIIAGADLLVLGMSSSAELARPEIAAGEAALKHGIRYGFYGDVPYCWARARQGVWFENLAPAAAFYLAVSEEDAQAAKAVFPQAELHGTGNPLREESVPPSSREEARRKLAIPPDCKLVLAIGGKFGAGNAAAWALIMEALPLLPVEFRLVLAAHIADKTEAGLYRELASYSPVPTLIADNKQLVATEVLLGADLVIDFGTSLGLEAAYRGIPVITLGLEILFRRLEKTAGNRDIESVKSGVSELVAGNSAELAKVMGRLLTREGFEPMRKRQQAILATRPGKGAALRQMAAALTKILEA